MLEDILLHINNRFRVKRLSGIYTILGGSLVIRNIRDGQYFWIEGSVFNDGLHQYPTTDLKDEIFEGDIYLLAIPKRVEDIAIEIEQWCEKNKDVINSPYNSESFGGYSYSKGGSGSSVILTGWQAQFAGALNPYRRINRLDW